MSCLTEEEFIVQREFRLKTLKNCGIYIIQNKINNHKYIGSSINIRHRFSQHKSTLRHNTHRNKHLQNAWNKYGEENFELFIIEHHAYPEKILNRENKHIQLYQPEYNNIQVNNEKQFFHSEETKLKIGIKSKQKYIDNPKLKDEWIERRKANPPWNKGKTNIYSKEVIKKLSEAMIKRHNLNNN